MVVLALVAMLVAVATIAGLLLVKSDDPTNNVTSTVANTTPATSTPSTPEVDPQRELLDLVPAEFPRRQCASRELAGDGDIASVECGQSGLDRAQLFGDAVTDCVPEVGYLFYAFDETHNGYVTCYVDEGDYAIIEWTDDENALYGVVSTQGGVDALPLLFEWWVLNS